ncbi:MAG: AIR synthase-related protein, partial [Fretibacterium sp.]|nr:AIR synthase-related protein [Fretibacterium sp.]
REAYEERVDAMGDFSLSALDMLYDAQTSGGLLLAVAPSQAEDLLQFCRENGFERSAIIGTLTEGEGRIRAVP